MPTITVQIEDTLQDNVDNCISELKDAIVEWLDDNKDADSVCINNDINYSGRLNGIVDSNTPIYTKEIDDTYYLHSDDLEEAYNNACIYNEQPDNYRQVCIYIYLEQQCHEWFNDLDIDLDDWRESGKSFEDFMEWNEE